MTRMGWERTSAGVAGDPGRMWAETEHLPQGGMSREGWEFPWRGLSPAYTLIYAQRY